MRGAVGKERFPMDEMEAFKPNLDLTEYAAAQGYELDRRESSRNSVILHKPHPSATVKRYVLDDILELFKKEGII